MARAIKREPLQPVNRRDQCEDLIETGEKADYEYAADQGVQADIRDKDRANGRVEELRYRADGRQGHQHREDLSYRLRKFCLAMLDGDQRPTLRPLSDQFA